MTESGNMSQRVLTINHGTPERGGGGGRGVEAFTSEIVSARRAAELGTWKRDPSGKQLGAVKCTQSCPKVLC